MYYKYNQNVSFDICGTYNLGYTVVCKLAQEYPPPKGMASKTGKRRWQWNSTRLKGQNVLVGNCYMHVHDAMVLSRHIQCSARTS